MTDGSHIDPESSLGALVAGNPARAALFDDLRLAYCCRGDSTLAEACRQRHVPLDDVLTILQAIDRSGGQDVGAESRDWRSADAAELCAHIVGVHHGGLRADLPRLERLFATVARVHGDSDPWLREGRRVFADLRQELEPHLASEESELFPACVAHAHTGARIDEGMIKEHEREHDSVGHALGALRLLCREYDRRKAFCDTHRALLDGLAAFEEDLHRHVHEENNILLRRAREEGAEAAHENSRHWH